MTEMRLTKTIFLKAPPEYVWRYLTEAKLLAVWFHEGEKDVTDGGEWNMLFNSADSDGKRGIWGQVKEFIPPTKKTPGRLVHGFSHDWLGDTVTICEWILEPIAGGTRLTLQHYGFEQSQGGFDLTVEHDKGWDQHFMRLRMVVA
ncbi:MAG: SRPBCC family protein [bacterium]